MRMLLAALILAAMFSLFGSAALQAAGDILPGGGQLPQTIYMAGDILPGGG